MAQPTFRHSGPPQQPDERRGTVWVYAVELAVTIGLGIGFLLLLLLVLQWIFPGGTGLGELVRSGGNDAVAGARLGFDATGGPMIAVLSDVQRDVLDKPASSVVWSPARSGIPLGDQHSIQTQAGSTATITFDENTVVELAEKSVIVVRSPRRVLGSRKRRASVVFMDGFLRGRVGRGEDDVELELLAAGATVRASGGADAGATVELAVRDDVSSLSVSEGTVELNWGGETTLVPEGFMVTYDGVNPPAAPQRAPRTPRLVSPEPDRRFDYRSAAPQVVFDWRPADDTSEFRLEIARDAEFSNLAYDDVLASSRMVHENLAAGKYFWRVTPRRGPMAGLPSPVRSLVVVRDDQPPDLEVDFPEGAVTRSTTTIRGATEPGSRVFVGDTSVTVRADGGFEFPLQVRDGYNFVVVQAVDPTGNTAFRNHTILARLDGTEGMP